MAAAVPDFSLYGEAPQSRAQPYVHVETIAHRSARHDWRIAPHIHGALHQLLLVRKGPGVAFAGGRAVCFRAPALILLPAGAVHGFEFSRDTQGHVVTVADALWEAIVLREPGIEGLLGTSLVIELDGDVERTADLAHSVAWLAHEFSRPAPARVLALEGLASVVFAAALRAADAAGGSARLHNPARGAGALAGAIAGATSGAAGGADNGRFRPPDAAQGLASKPALVQHFLHLVAGHYRDGWPVSRYAATLGVSPSTLRHACARSLHSTPLQVVHRRMLSEAKRALWGTRRSVREIADALGFADAAYFTRFFSSRVGLSPLAYRALAEQRVNDALPPASIENDEGL